MKKNKLIITVAFVYLIVLIISPDKCLLAIKNSGYYLFEMLTVMPVVFLLTVVIDALIPQNIITKQLGENSGLKGNLFSFILGSLSAGPIYAAFPICSLLLKKGASISNIVIILSSWAVIKVPMLANEVKFLGMKFMIVRWILTVLSIFFMSWLISLFIKKKDIIQSEINYSTDLLSINTDYCIGCKLCVKKFPQYFEVLNKKAIIKSIPSKNQLEKIKDICEKCPAKAIVIKDINKEDSLTIE